MEETLAELPLIGDQVGLFKAQPGRDRGACSATLRAIRMVVQLTLVGLVLTTLFSVVSPLWTGIAALGMVLFAGHEAAQRQNRRLSGWWS